MRLPVYVRVLLTAALYFVAGMAGLAVPFTQGNISPIWPASGVAIACLLLFGRRCWPGILAGAFLVNFPSHMGFATSLGLAAGNTLAAFVGTTVLLRIPGSDRSLKRLRDMMGLILVAVVYPLISSSIGTAVLHWAQRKPWPSLTPTWVTYFLGDAMGILLITPLVLAVRAVTRFRPNLHAAELAVLMVTAAVASAGLFDERLVFAAHHAVLVLLMFPFVLWAAIRFGVGGAALINVLVASIAIVATAKGAGPFSRDLPFQNALLLQVFLATMSISGLLLSAVISERQEIERERQSVIATARERAEEEAHKSRKELQEVLDNAPVMIYMKDPQGRYTFVNRCWSETLRFDGAAALGKTDFELFPMEAAREFGENDRSVVERGCVGEFEEQAVLVDGLHTYQSIKVGLRDSAGVLYGLCGISTDITERKRKEETLRQVNRALRVLSRCNSAVVHAIEEQALLDDVCNIAVGPAGYDLAWVGFADHDERKTVRPVASAGPVEGFLDQIHVSWADNKFGRGSIGPAIREGRSVVVRRLHEQPNFDTWREVIARRSFESVLSVPLRVGGEIIGALAIYAKEMDAFDSSEVELIEELGRNLAHGIESIRARKERAEAMAALEKARQELEERVRQRTIELEKAKDAAESADRIKSAFLAAMSHELRTPLNSIIGFTGIVLQGMAGPLSEEQKKQLGMVQHSARHLLDLINDVLDISKIEAGQLEIHCAPFSLPESVRRTVATISPLAQKKGIALHTEIAPTVSEVHSDQRRVEQVLLNLLGNAVKFTDEGGVYVRCSSEDGWVVLAVRDTGIGIAPQHHKSIFEPFRQVDAGVSRKHEGTGLGLSICQRLVERLGGFIFVESDVGRGSTFTVRMPAKWDVKP